jgi:hypothetical protein
MKFEAHVIIFYYSSPSNQELKPKDFLNKGGRSQVFTVKEETPLICIVEQLANYLDNLNVKIVVHVEGCFIDDVINAFKMTTLIDRVSYLIIIYFTFLFV